MSAESRAARWIRTLVPVHRGETVTAALLTTTVFVIMTAYYLLKTAREGLILSGGMFGLGGAELKMYASGAMAILLIGLVPAYSAFASRVRRIRLIGTSYALVIVCLAVFYGLALAGAPIGLPFFIWLGLVSVFLVAQFWSYANDLYSEEQGNRLFAIIAIGGALGAIVGPQLARLAHTAELLLIAAVLLVVALLLFETIEHSRRRHGDLRTQPIVDGGGFRRVMRSKYLFAIAAMVMVANLVNSVGEFLLSNAVTSHVAQLTTSATEKRELIKSFYGDFFFWVNLLAFLVQALLVSHLIAWFGVRRVLFVLPVIALGAYGAIGMGGGIAVVRVMKIAENSTDYSVQNTVRQTLFLPTDRGAKYKAKAAIDTFFVRFGDALSALLVLVGFRQLGLTPRQLAFVNVGLVALWFVIAVVISRRYGALEREAKG